MIHRLLAPIVVALALLGVALAPTPASAAVAPPPPAFFAFGACQVRLTFLPYGIAPTATLEVRSATNRCYKVQVQMFSYSDCGTYCQGHYNTKTSGKYPLQFTKYTVTGPCCAVGVWARAAVWTANTTVPAADWVLWADGHVT